MNALAVLLRLRRLEGCIPWMYRDSGRGEVTCAIGQMIPSVSFALTLPWHIDTRPATPEEITIDFAEVQAAPAGKPSSFYASLTRCRLEENDMTALANQRIAELTAEIGMRLPMFPSFPEPVQQAVFDMAYNLGLYKFMATYTRFQSALKAGDWSAAAAESRRDGIGDSRNNEIAALIRSAATAPQPIS